MMLASDRLAYLRRRRSFVRTLALGAVALGVSVGGRAADTSEAAGLEARVDHAEQFVGTNFFAEVRNSVPTFHWIGNTDRFSYWKVL
jgi:hypothetical protein